MNTVILIIAVLIVVTIFAKRKGYIQSGMLARYFSNKTRDDVLKELKAKSDKLEAEAKKEKEIQDLKRKIAESESILKGTPK